jgi:hypothetical protein
VHQARIGFTKGVDAEFHEAKSSLVGYRVGETSTACDEDSA